MGTESDIYNNYSYTSCTNQEIEKTPETHPKKLEFNINKPETGLNKIDFNITFNDNEIDDINDNKVVHPSDDLGDDDYINIKDHEIQEEQTNRNSFYTLFYNNYNRALIQKIQTKLMIGKPQTIMKVKQLLFTTLILKTIQYAEEHSMNCILDQMIKKMVI